jgi:D-glycero-D-manno-heptose 1,7-bisphosphate phosphatase
MRRAVFLDRDGVLNQSFLMDGIPKPPINPSEVVILERVSQAIQILKNHGLLVVVVTNQPDVARGTMSRNQAEAINDRVQDLTSLEHFYSCFHDDVDECDCRKPSPGLLRLAALELEINLSQSFLVGDRWRDIQAGNAVNCKSFFIDYSYSEKQPNKPFVTVKSLYHAAQLIVKELTNE